MVKRKVLRFWLLSMDIDSGYNIGLTSEVICGYLNSLDRNMGGFWPKVAMNVRSDTSSEVIVTPESLQLLNYDIFGKR